MRHEECMKNDEEYRMTYEVLKKNELSLDKIIEVVVKSNGIVGVGVVSLKQHIDSNLDELMRGY